MALFRRFATVSGYTGLSRVLGLVRDILFARFLGAEDIADVFFVAFRLPNMFRRIFAEGAFNAAFVPLFARRMEEDGEALAKAFAEQALAVLLAALLALTAVAIAAMPWLMYVLAWGFDVKPEKFDLAVELTRITFPYLLFISLAALLGGVLNALYRFAAAAAAPLLLNIFFIAALAVLVPLSGQPGHVLAWTVALAGIAQCLLLVIASRRAGMRLRLVRPRLTPGVRGLWRLMVPGILSAGVLQLNLVITNLIASFEPGAVSKLYYADRLYQLPLGLIGIGLGVVLLPELSRKLRRGARQEAMASLNRGLELAMLFTVPATVALLLIPWPIVVVLYERGAFDRATSDATALAVAAFAAGLPAYVLMKIFQPGFFAQEDTVTPLKISVVSIAVTVVFAVVLFFQFDLGVAGLALATAIGAWVNVTLLVVGLRRREFLDLDRRNRRRLPRIVLASLIMGAALWYLQSALAGWFDLGLWAGIAGLGILVGGGVAAYGAAALALGAVRLSDMKLALGRGS
ncbi:MAG: murein biosynthesis integral membrane protein MurJ [Rhodospirillales bacterium]|nr:murein biosynthesis integral membrane protein MurJ [Rhodospirillales bacterium]